MRLFWKNWKKKKPSYMTYDVLTHELRTNDGQFLKKLECPLNKKWQELTVIPSQRNERHCHSCQKKVVDISDKTATEAIAFF
jgi:hypothetical protein